MSGLLEDLKAITKATRERRERDAETHAQLDKDLCMLCHAHGEDKRSLRIECFYAVEEVVPEALDLYDVGGEWGYFLRICKSCRGALLDRLGEWRNERVALRDQPKDHDGYLLEGEGERTDATVPVRRNGRIIYITEEEWRTEHARVAEGGQEGGDSD